MLRFFTCASVITLLIACADRCSAGSVVAQAPQPIAARDIRVGGELGQRLQASFDRLEREDYRPPMLFDKPNEGWPGDKEGRTLFGLTLLAQVTGREPKYLHQAIEMYGQRVNADGYLGPIASPDAISEQALGGQFWVVRGLYEYAGWRDEPRAADWADRVVKRVYLSAGGEFEHYPIDPASRKSTDLVYGQEVARSGKWILSTDIGCGLAGSLDALTTAYARQPSKELETAVEEAISRFRQMDLEAISAQLHSTLISTRSLLRHYGATGRDELLDYARKVYGLYRERAMTDHFENHNWFGRPEWTEGCAVVDSFIVAVQLWQFTGDLRYLEDAHHIYYNGLCVNQRANGGFGCDSCPSVADPFLTVKTPEASWCCTQRGADGLASAARFSFFTDRKGAYVTFFRDAEATLRWNDGLMKIRTQTKYPFDGHWRLEFIETDMAAVRALRLFLPAWAEKPRLKLNGQPLAALPENGFLSVERTWAAGDVLELLFDQRVVAKPPLNRVNGADKDEYHTFHYGPLILAAEKSSCAGVLPTHTPHPVDPVALDSDVRFSRQGDHAFAVDGTGVTLTPIYHLLDPSFSQERGYRRQVLFQSAK